MRSKRIVDRRSQQVEMKRYNIIFRFIETFIMIKLLLGRHNVEQHLSLGDQSYFVMYMVYRITRLLFDTHTHTHTHCNSASGKLRKVRKALKHTGKRLRLSNNQLCLSQALPHKSLIFWANFRTTKYIVLIIYTSLIKFLVCLSMLA